MKCALQDNDNALYQVKKFKYLCMVFTNAVKYNKEIDARTDKAIAFLRELYRSVVTKRELSKTTKLSIFKRQRSSSLGFIDFETVFVPILTYHH